MTEDDIQKKLLTMLFEIHAISVSIGAVVSLTHDFFTGVFSFLASVYILATVVYLKDIRKPGLLRQLV